MKRTSALFAAVVLGAAIAAAGTGPASAQKAPARPSANAATQGVLLRQQRELNGMMLTRPTMNATSPTTTLEFRPPTMTTLRQIAGVGTVTAVRGNTLMFRAHNGAMAMLRLRTTSGRISALRAGTLMRLQLLSNGFVRIQAMQPMTKPALNSIKP